MWNFLSIHPTCLGNWIQKSTTIFDIFPLRSKLVKCNSPFFCKVEKMFLTNLNAYGKWPISNHLSNYLYLECGFPKCKNFSMYSNRVKKNSIIFQNFIYQNIITRNFLFEDSVWSILVIQTFLFPTTDWLQNQLKTSCNIETLAANSNVPQLHWNCATINHCSSSCWSKKH